MITNLFIMKQCDCHYFGLKLGLIETLRVPCVCCVYGGLPLVLTPAPHVISPRGKKNKTKKQLVRVCVLRGGLCVRQQGRVTVWI